jgi:phasin family protein
VNFNTNKFFAGFDSVPAFTPFQSLFSDAGERGQDAVRRTQKAAEELADLTRANVEAFVESGRVAAEGVRSLGQDVVASGRDGVEKAADAIRTLAEAKSPTEYLQLQSEIARSSFDRMVAESSRLTESFVKLAGEAIQPVSNRASANAERLNSLVA